MNLQTYLNERNITRYKLATSANIPFSTLNDICNGKTSIENCSVKTAKAIADTLNISIDELVKMNYVNEKNSKSDFSSDVEYYKTMTQDKDVILAFDSALDNHFLTNGNSSDRIAVYSKEKLSKPFECHIVKRFDKIEYELVNGIKTTTINQSINDMLSHKKINDQALLEAIGKYFFKHDESFDGLTIEEKNKKRFEIESYFGIHYWDDEEEGIDED